MHSLFQEADIVFTTLLYAPGGPVLPAHILSGGGDNQ
jgi:hypothetical protein